MSRIQKYKESLYKFIKDKSCLMKDNYINNSQINDYIYNQSKNNDLIFSILLLTVMNSQNKKNHITMQGYYVASSIEMLNMLLYFIEHKTNIINKIPPPDNYTKTYNDIVICANKSLHQNLESIKNTHYDKPSNFVAMILTSLTVFNDSLKTINDFNNFKFVLTDKSCNNNIIKWYLKENNDLIKKFKNFKQIDKKSFDEYIEMKYLVLCEIAIILGWIMGGGDIKDINKLKKLAKYFSIMYKISKDFENLNNDINVTTNYTPNYILNYGIQDSYEIFIENKQKFIEESMLQDIYTNTIKEIIDTIEINVDMVIDQTSPDLKSNYSSIKN